MKPVQQKQISSILKERPAGMGAKTGPVTSSQPNGEQPVSAARIAGGHAWTTVISAADFFVVGQAL